MNDLQKNVEKFLPYLEDVRRRLYRGAILFVASFVTGFLCSRIILKKILKIVHFEDVVVATSSPFQYANVAMDVGFTVATIVTTPYIIYSLYSFIASGLSQREKILLLKFVPLSLGLFIFGFCYGFLMLYYALGLFASINISLGVANFWNISSFLSELLMTSALLGLVFQFPIVITFFLKVGVLVKKQLKHHRRFAYFFALCITALLPPTDGLSLLAMTLPLVLLYEGTILFN